LREFKIKEIFIEDVANSDEKIAAILQGLLSQTQLRKINLTNCEVGAKSHEELLKIFERKTEGYLESVKFSKLKIVSS
jgi:hypothetical protein